MHSEDLHREIHEGLNVVENRNSANNFIFLWEESFLPQLRKASQGFLSRDEGWDDVTYWVFEKI